MAIVLFVAGVCVFAYWMRKALIIHKRKPVFTKTVDIGKQEKDASMTEKEFCKWLREKV